VPKPSQESERSCTCVLEVLILSLFTIFQLDSGTVPTVWYFFSFLGTDGTGSCKLPHNDDHDGLPF
jgi:hypothetical protein